MKIPLVLSAYYVVKAETPRRAGAKFCAVFFALALGWSSLASVRKVRRN